MTLRNGRIGRRTAACVLCAATLALALSPAAALTLADVRALAYAPASAASLPRATGFVDEQGQRVTLGAYVQARPAILVPGYYGCSSLCGVVMHSLVAALRDARLEPGRDVEVVAVSIAPLETPAIARARMAALLGPGAHPGWHFLTGSDAAIGALTRALGYRATYDAASGSYAHPAGITIVAQGGTLGPVLGGVAFPPADLRAAIAERGLRAAAAGQPPGTAVAQRTTAAASTPRWLLCFHDAIAGGQYDDRVMAAVRAGSVAVMVALAVIVLGARRNRRAGRREAA